MSVLGKEKPPKRGKPKDTDLYNYKVVYMDGYIEEGDVDVEHNKVFHVRNYYKRSEASLEYRRKSKSKSKSKSKKRTTQNT